MRQTERTATIGKKFVNQADISASTVIQGKIVMTDNVLQTRLRHLYEEGNRFDMNVEAFRRDDDSETIGQSGSGNKISVWVRLIDIHDSGSAILGIPTDY